MRIVAPTLDLLTDGSRTADDLIRYGDQHRKRINVSTVLAGQKLGIKDYTDAKVQEEMKDDRAFKSVKEGLKDKEDKVLMKPAEGLSDDEIKALVQYVRTFKK